MNSWELHSETAEIWNSMLTDIDKAKTSIEIEQYSFWDDSAGHRFLELLEAKHKQGVQVRIIVDGWGSYPLFQSNYVRLLMRSGIEIKPFNPVSLFRASSWFYHLHKKTLVIDSTIGWVGGIGIKKKFRHFKDAMLRIEGPAVRQIQQAFEMVWVNVGQKNYNFSGPALSQPDEDINLYINYCGYGKKEIYEQLRQRIQNAEKSIYFTTSYFFPDRNFFQLILDKAREGIDVKIILRGKDDEFLPVRFSSSYFQKALDANIGIYRYEPAIIHAKTAIIDDKWATVGSSNLDKFSFYYNMEANMASADSQFVSETLKLFSGYIQHCRKIELNDWKNRPLAERLIEIAIWPIHNYL